jgi:hypothetical protein
MQSWKTKKILPSYSANPSCCRNFSIHVDDEFAYVTILLATPGVGDNDVTEITKEPRYFLLAGTTLIQPCPD